MDSVLGGDMDIVSLGLIAGLKKKVAQLGSGSPKGVYDTFVELQTDNPDHDFIYLALDTGNWYYWDNTASAWTSGGVYQNPIDGTANRVAGFDSNGKISSKDLADMLLSQHRMWTYIIPGSNFEVLAIKNQKDTADFTIFECYAPYSYLDNGVKTKAGEATWAQHIVAIDPTGGDQDWVRDMSLHNYAGFMKVVDVISDFTHTIPGIWEWVSRYSNGTPYSMVERIVMHLDGDTGGLFLGEGYDMPQPFKTVSEARLHVRPKQGWNPHRAGLFEIDSVYDPVPPALEARNMNNYAHPGALVKFHLRNAGDSGPVLVLSNAGTGDYLQCDSVANISKNGQVTALGFTPTSKREAKKDIEPYTDSALDLLELVDIQKFKFKEDTEGIQRVGFIADDTDELLAGPKHDHMDLGNAVGLLIKGIQELRQENRELRAELTALKGE